MPAHGDQQRGEIQRLKELMDEAAGKLFVGGCGLHRLGFDLRQHGVDLDKVVNGLFPPRASLGFPPIFRRVADALMQAGGDEGFQPGFEFRIFPRPAPVQFGQRIDPGAQQVFQPPRIGNMCIDW